MLSIISGYDVDKFKMSFSAGGVATGDLRTCAGSAAGRALAQAAGAEGAGQQQR